jgi:hypothetical protein
MMRSSQGVVVPYHFGDAPDKMPSCPDLSTDPDATSVRKEVYKELIPTGVLRLKKYVKNNPRTYYTADELQHAVEMHPTITKSVLIEAMNDRAFGLAMHRNGFTIRPRTNAQQSPLQIRIKSDEETTPGDPNNDECGSDFVQIIARQPTDDPNIGKILIYKMLNAKCWPIFAKMVIGQGRDIAQNIAAHVRLLYEEGAFIGADELPRHRNPAKNPYIGFVDIFDTTIPFHVILYDHDRGMFRDATDMETNAIKAKRRESVRPRDSQLYAVIEPHTYKKKFDVPITNEIKVFTASSTKGGKQKGVVCESLKKNDTVNYIAQLGTTVQPSVTKEQLCFTLGLELARVQKLFFPPSFKPT